MDASFEVVALKDKETLLEKRTVLFGEYIVVLGGTAPSGRATVPPQAYWSLFT
jgi:hypothetical protein